MAPRVHPLPYPADPGDWLARLRSLGGAIWLDSGDRGRFSLLAAAPVAGFRREVGALCAFGDIADLEHDFTDTFAAASWLLSRLDPLEPDPHWPFAGGVMGYFGYDLGRELETLPATAPAALALPDAWLGLYTWALCLDHERQQAALVCHPSTDPATTAAVLERLDENPPAPAPFTLNAAMAPLLDRQDYRAAIGRIQDHILAGDVYQVNFAQPFRASYRGDPFTAYRHLRQRLPAPYGAYLDLPQGAVLSCSPEQFLNVDGDRVHTRPIKGTRPRHADPATDAAAATELAASEKDRAENLMIVDLLRNDLSKSCQPGSVAVPELFALHSHPNVHHLVSTVTGQRRPECDVFDLLRGCFPGGSITGAPKIRAMSLIETLEPVRRHLYCGSLGYWSCDGRSECNIAIRTLLADRQHLWVWGGGGIVADSDWAAEYQETLDKVGVLMDALGEL